MKKVSIILSIILVFSLVSCLGVDVLTIEHEGITYYSEYADGIKTITNYYPYNIFALPDYQELIQYGDGAGLENEGVVYFIYIVDTSMDSDDSRAYYCAELDGETKELLCEDGEYFSSEAEKNEVVERLLEVIELIYVP